MKFAKFSLFLTACLGLYTSASAQERVVSIGGDVSEIIYALNAEQNLVGRDSTSLIPAQVKSLPDVGYMRSLNAEGILALKPTKVIATSVAQPSVVLEQLKQAGVAVETVELGNTAESVVKKIKRVGEIVGKVEQAGKLAEKFTKEVEAVPNSPLDVKILFILSRSGTNQMAAGKDTVPDTAIRMVGAKNAMANSTRYTPISQEGVIAANPDLVVMTTLGVEGLGSLDKVWTLSGLAHTNAAKHKQIVVVDDIAFLAFGLTMPGELQKIRQAAEKAVK